MVRNRLFSWRLIMRYVAFGAVPLVLTFVLAEFLFGGATVGTFFVVLAFLLPFVALTWLGYQHFRKR